MIYEKRSLDIARTIIQIQIQIQISLLWNKLQIWSEKIYIKKYKTHTNNLIETLEDTERTVCTATHTHMEAGFVMAKKQNELAALSTMSHNNYVYNSNKLIHTK